MTILRRPEARLILQKSNSGRPSDWNKETDYNVLFRERVVGRLWSFDYADSCSGAMAQFLWHWYWREGGSARRQTGACSKFGSGVTMSIIVT
jgi:hypothetical protein